MHQSYAQDRELKFIILFLKPCACRSFSLVLLNMHPALIALDPLFLAHVKLFIKDTYALQAVESAPIGKINLGDPSQLSH